MSDEVKKPIKKPDSAPQATQNEGSDTPKKEERFSAKEKKKTSKYAQKKHKKKGFRRVTRGHVYIKSTYNNTIITITDLAGNTLVWASAGGAGFNGAKKATPYAAGIVAKNVIESVRPYGLGEVDVFLRGIGAGREAAVRGLQGAGIEILSIKDITPIPHNGCRPKKARRV